MVTRVTFLTVPRTTLSTAATVVKIIWRKYVHRHLRRHTKVPKTGLLLEISNIVIGDQATTLPWKKIILYL